MNDSMKHSQSTVPGSLKQAAAPTEASKPISLAHDDIARRAYEIYVQKGCRKGECRQNWQLAEQELRQTQQKQKAEQVMQNEGGTGGEKGSGQRSGSTPSNSDAAFTPIRDSRDSTRGGMTPAGTRA